MRTSGFCAFHVIDLGSTPNPEQSSQIWGPIQRAMEACLHDPSDFLFFLDFFFCPIGHLEGLS